MSPTEHLKESPNADRLISLAKGQLNSSLDMKVSSEEDSDIADSVWKAFVSSIESNDFQMPGMNRKITLEDLSKTYEVNNQLMLLTYALLQGGYSKQFESVISFACKQSEDLGKVIQKLSDKHNKKGVNYLIFSTAGKFIFLSLLLAEEFQSLKMYRFEKICLVNCGRAVTATLAHYPEKVGEIFCRIADFYERTNETSQAKDHYLPYIKDVKWILKEFKDLSQVSDEQCWTLHYFNQCCEGYLRLGGEDKKGKIARYFKTSSEILQLFEEE